MKKSYGLHLVLAGVIVLALAAAFFLSGGRKVGMQTDEAILNRLTSPLTDTVAPNREMLNNLSGPVGGKAVYPPEVRDRLTGQGQ